MVGPAAVVAGGAPTGPCWSSGAVVATVCGVVEDVDNVGVAGVGVTRGVVDEESDAADESAADVAGFSSSSPVSVAMIWVVGSPSWFSVRTSTMVSPSLRKCEQLL